MIDFDRSLLSYVERVLLSRDVTPDYAAKVRYCNRKFCEWLGFDPGIDGVDCQPVNEFLVYLHGRGLRPDTLAGYRRAILLVWGQAYRDGDNDHPPLRVRRIRCPRDVIEAFTHEALQRLLAYVGTLQGYFPNGVVRRDFWTGAIHAAYSTGLRRGDLLRVKRSQIDSDGVARVLQNKTGYAVTVRFSEPALKAIESMANIGDPRALPWPYHENALSRQFRRLCAAAGARGQFRWLRRSAGSYADSVQPGAGPKLLGHRSERIFRAYYDCDKITAREPVTPPPI